MRRREAWGTLRHLVVEGSPQQAATMLSALLLGYADHGPDRAALLCEISFAQLMADEAEAAVTTARRAIDEANRAVTRGSARAAGAGADDDTVGPRAYAAATLALALAVRGPGREPEHVVTSALESASDLLLDLDPTDAAAPMATYLVAETALLHGRFVAAEEAAQRGRVAATGADAADPVDPIALVLSEIVLARSLVLRGRRADGAALAAHAADRAARLSMAALEGLGRGLEAVIAAADGDRTTAAEVERRARRLSSPTGKSLPDIGTWLLLAYAAFLQGRHTEATHMVVTVSGGHDLPRLPWTLRHAVIELLATAAVADEKLDEASAWLAVAPQPTARVDRRTSAVSRLERGAGSPRSGLLVVGRGGDEPPAPSDETAGGWHALTPRERHVAELASRGLNNRQVAERLFLSERVVRLHLERVFRVMGIHGRTMLPAALSGIVESRTLAPQVALTERQEDVAELVAGGLTNAQVAEKLGMSVKTVEKHLRDVFARWSVNSRSAVASAWVDYVENGVRRQDRTRRFAGDVGSAS